MGRPRRHDETTRDALLAAAEALVEAGGPGRLSVRGVADAVGTTTRAVYSLFGSKEGMLTALAQRSFELLRDEIARLPVTADPASDLVTAGVEVFRPMAIDHPSMFALAFLRAAPDLELDEHTRAVAREGLELLRDRVARLAAADLLGRRDVDTATAQFNAMCQGLAATELRNASTLGPQPAKAWRAAFETLLGGFRTPVAAVECSADVDAAGPSPARARAPKGRDVQE
jgi:AcrR family transcriptional regulator